jgi:glutaredoxin 3
MNTVTLYATDTCPYCRNAKALLASRGIAAEEINVQAEPGKFQEMLSRSGGRRSVPQIFIGQTHVGGFDELARLDRQGSLLSMLA